MQNFKRIVFSGLLLISLCVIFSCSQTGKDIPEPRPYVLESSDDSMIINVYADGYHSLNLQEKVVSYYLYLSAVSGKDFFYDREQLDFLNSSSGAGSSENGGANGSGMDTEETDKIDMACDYLNKASSYTTDYHKQVLLDLIDIIRNSRLEELERFKNLWIDVNSNITFLNGFISDDKTDNIKGVFFVDKKSDAVMQRIIGNIGALKQVLPWREEYQNYNSGIINMNSENILLGNDVEIGLPFVPGRTIHYTGKTKQANKGKFYYFNNIAHSVRKSLGYMIIDEFTLPEEMEALKQYSDIYEPVFDMLREILGQVLCNMDRLSGSDSSSPSEDRSAILNRAVADLSALYLMTDPILSELGILKSMPAAADPYKSYLINSLFGLKYVHQAPDSLHIRTKAANLVLQYLTGLSGKVRIDERNGRSYLVMSDPDEMKQAVTGLIRELIDMNLRNDPEEIRGFIDRYALAVNFGLRDEMISRSESIDYPVYIKLAYPYLEPRFNDNDGIVDVFIEMPESYREQKKRFSETSKK